MESLKDETRDLVMFPIGRKPIGSKWVFKRKMNAEDQIEKYKAPVLVKGYSQVEGVGLNEIFSHVAKLDSIRVLMSLDATLDLKIEQMDVKKTFLHGDFEEYIYMN